MLLYLYKLHWKIFDPISLNRVNILHCTKTNKTREKQFNGDYFVTIQMHVNKMALIKLTTNMFFLSSSALIVL